MPDEHGQPINPAEQNPQQLQRIRVFEQKIEEYFLSCQLPQIRQHLHGISLAQWPLYRFSIAPFYEGVWTTHGPERASLIADKLIDIKLNYAYLLTLFEHFHRGTTLIVGNNELEKLNPNTFSLLRQIHYRVYLLSVLGEQVLDLLFALQTGDFANFKKNKWPSIIQRVQTATGNEIITENDSALLLQFKATYRTAELHKFSMVRAFTSKTEWSHLQPEEDAIKRILDRAHSYYAKPSSSTTSPLLIS